MSSSKLLSLFISFCLLFEQSLFAQSIDLSHYFANSGKAVIQSDKFRPLHLRYLGYDNLSRDFKILLDKGDAKKEDLENKAYIEENTQTLLKYFFIGLSLPNEKFWVNLRPDSPDNILDSDLEKTDIGRIFLEADLQLKKDTASFTSPQTPQGKAYWDKLYKKAGELFGSENITIPTITRPWIVPGEIIIREAPDNAYIYKATLKVMLEEDYLTSRGGSRTAPTPDQYTFSDPRLKELNQYSTQLIKETIIPKLTYEVNTSKRYAPLRQVYYSLILAQWFKQKYGSFGSIRAPGTSAPVNNYISMIDSGNLTNLTSSQSYDKQAYFQQYQKSFKDGEYNLQEPVYTPMGQSIRRYTSGGMMLNISSSSLTEIETKKALPPPKFAFVIPAKAGYLTNSNNIFDFGPSIPEERKYLYFNKLKDRLESANLKDIILEALSNARKKGNIYWDSNNITRKRLIINKQFIGEAQLQPYLYFKTLQENLGHRRYGSLENPSADNIVYDFSKHYAIPFRLLLVNYPYLRNHFLLAATQKRQQVNLADLELVSLISELTESGWYLNNNNSGASEREVLHFQFFTGVLPIEGLEAEPLISKKDLKVGLLKNYPGTVFVIESKDRSARNKCAFSLVKTLQGKNHPFNLYGFSDRVYIIPRKAESSRLLYDWNVGMPTCAGLLIAYPRNSKVNSENEFRAQTNRIYEAMNGDVYEKTIRDLVSQDEDTDYLRKAIKNFVLENENTSARSAVAIDKYHDLLFKLNSIIKDKEHVLTFYNRDNLLNQQLLRYKALKLAIEGASSAEVIINILHDYNETKISDTYKVILEALAMEIPDFNKQNVIFINESSILYKIFGFDNVEKVGQCYKLEKGNEIILVKAETTGKYILGSLMKVLIHEYWHTKGYINNKILNEGVVEYLAIKTLKDIFLTNKAMRNLIIKESPELFNKLSGLSTKEKFDAYKNKVVSYKIELALIERLIIIAGEEPIIKAYKTGDISDLPIEKNLRNFSNKNSSPLTTDLSAINEPGGIAFNALPIQTESVISSALGALAGSHAFKGDLDAEWAQIQAVFNAGIRPSAQRLADFAAAGVASPLATQRREDVLGLVAELLRRDEEDVRLAPIDPTLKGLLNALESLS